MRTCSGRLANSAEKMEVSSSDTIRECLIFLFVHVLLTAVRVSRSGSVRSAIAESILFLHQRLILNRSRRRAPNLQVADRLIACGVVFRQKQAVLRQTCQ
jgi:hypothetical protein